MRGAEQIYRAILSKRPRESMAITLLGLVCCQTGRGNEAIGLIEGAIHIDDRPFYQFSLGEALIACGRPADAVAPFRRSVAMQSNIAAVHLGLARALMASGDHAAAVEPARNAVLLAPGEPEPYVCVGLLLDHFGQPEQALDQLETALGVGAGHATAWDAICTVQLKLGRIEQAVDAGRRAVSLDPRSAAAHLHLGDALHAGHADEAALEAYQAAATAGAAADAHCHGSNALYDLGRLEEAATWAAKAVELAPAHADAYCNLGNALQALLRFDAAELAYRHAAMLRPQSAPFLSNLSVVLTAQGRLDEALAAQTQALALDPAFVDANYNHAVTLLMAGHYERGWRHYEWRWQLAWSPPRGFMQPQWSGEDLAGRTVLIHPEQGLGDTLQMMRLAPMVTARGGRVVLEVQRPLLRLAQSLAGVAEIVAVGDKLPSFDLHCPLFSLPAALGLRLDTVPGRPYLAADPALVRRVSRFGGTSGPRIGLVWRGAERIGRHVNEERSIPLERLAPLLATRSATFFSLQMDPGADCLRSMCEFGMTDLMTGVSDFAETAAHVQGLDLVISVDTSTAHLAAAMGKPVWLLSRYNGCWRWLKDRSDSPWYPSMRIWRQDRPKDWEPVIARVAAALRTELRSAA